MEIYVDGPRDANRLYIFAGTAVFNWHVTNDDAWNRDPLYIPMSLIPDCPLLWADQIVDQLATASLASIRFRDSPGRDTVGFAVDSVHTRFLPRPRDPAAPDFGLDVFLALRGGDVFMYRVSFQLNILARV